MTWASWFKAPHPLPDEKLAKLSTQRLLQVLKIARRASNGNVCDSCGEHFSQCVGMSEKDRADFMICWKEALDYEARVKAVLAKREHLDRRA